MPTPDRQARFARYGALAALLAVTGLVTACGVKAPTPVPTATPAPSRYAVATPYPHLLEPATADAVYLGLLADGLVLTPIDSSTGKPGGDPVKRINATYEGWPLAIIQYRSAQTVSKATGWKSGVKPGKGEVPIQFMGLNVLVQWGPAAGSIPKPPDARQLEAASALRGALDRLLSPLQARTIVPVPPSAPTSAPTPVPSPAPSTKASTNP